MGEHVTPALEESKPDQHFIMWRPGKFKRMSAEIVMVAYETLKNHWVVWRKLSNGSN
jgi:hypothetical protein